MAGLKFRNVNKTYDNGLRAVTNFNLDVNDGEFVVLVGPSGCGKSTALRMIAGLEKITSGEIFIGERMVNGLDPKDRNIAMVFQNYALYPNMTVADNISYGLRMHGVDKLTIKSKVESVAETLGLTQYLKCKPDQLSGGQRQRVALGRAMVREPDVYLLDEPLSNLDAKLRTKMRSEILALHKKLKTTFVYVTHDQVEAMTMGDRIVVMKNGAAHQIGTPSALYKHPADMHVAGFIGSPQMNFFKGRTLDGKLTIETQAGKFRMPSATSDRTLPEYLAADKEIVLGVRPEHIGCAPAGRRGARVEATLVNVEDLCTHTLLYLEKDGVEFTGYGPADFAAASGSRVTVSLDLSAASLFDAQTEKSVLTESPEAARAYARARSGETFPEVWETEGSYTRRRGLYNGKKVLMHFAVIGGAEIETYYEFNKNMYRLGRSILKKKLIYGFNLSALRPAEENGQLPVTRAVVTEVKNCGKAQYSLIDIGGCRLAMRGAFPVGESIAVAVDFSCVAVSDIDGTALITPAKEN